MILDGIFQGVLDQEKGRLIVYDEPEKDVRTLLLWLSRMSTHTIPFCSQRMPRHWTPSSKSAKSSEGCLTRLED